MYGSWLLAFVALLAFYTPLLFIKLLCNTKNSNLLTFGYFAGGSFYIILPSFLPVVLGRQIIDFTYAYDAYFGSEVLDKVYLIIITYSIFCLIGFFIGFGLWSVGRGVKNTLQTTDFESRNSRYLLFVFIMSLIVSWLITINGLNQGVVSTGERGQGLPTSILLIINSALIVSMALLMNVFKKDRHRVVLLGLVFLLFFTQSIFVAGSRRMVVFFILFVVGPVLLRLRVIGKVFVFVSVPVVVFAVIVFGVIRKSLHEFDSLSSVIMEFPTVVAELKNNTDLILMNADFAIVFDAFIGVLKQVPDQVDYLYGDTFLKIFYFMIPRTVWPDKPHTISVVVTDKIYNMDSSAVTFNPNLLGEMYFNGGFISVSIVGFIVGMLLGYSLKFTNKLSDAKLSYTVFFGIISMSFFNLWRGYTFEVIFNLLFIAFAFYAIRFIGKVKFFQKKQWKY